MQAKSQEDAAEHVCLNCGTRFRGDFCPFCSQKGSTQRLNMKTTINNFFNRFVRVDHGLIHTIIDLLYRPGYMVRDYIRGYRTEYTEPLMLFIILLALSYMVPGYDSDISTQTLSPETAKILAGHPLSLQMTKLSYWVNSDMQRMALFICFLIAPTVCLTQRIIRVKGNALNLSESLHLLLYAMCVEQFLELVFCILAWIFSINNDMYNQGGIIFATCVMFFDIIIMVRDSSDMSWKKTLLFVLFEPLICLIFLFLFFGLFFLIIYIDLPKELHYLMKEIIPQ